MSLRTKLEPNDATSFSIDLGPGNKIIKVAERVGESEGITVRAD